jgi:hypothetical protein
MSERGKISPIGDLAKSIVSKLAVSDTTTPGLTEKPSATATIAERRGALSKIPTLGLGTGSTALPSLSEAMAQGDPRLIDRSLIASLPLRLRSSLTERWENRSTEEYGWDAEFLGYAWLAPPDDDDEIRQALIMLEPTLVPGRTQEIIVALTQLRFTTISRNIDASDWKMTLAAYASGVARYPGDCVLDAIKFWSENEKFWPALVELRVLIERRCRRRHSLKILLETTR